MCNITDYQYTCKHHIQHVWSACRGQIKATKDSNTPACQKSPSLYVNYLTICGSCARAEAEQKLRRDLKESDHDSTESFESAIQGRLAEIATRIPTTNWRQLPSPVYGRKPSQKRLHTLRKHSLLRVEVKSEDMGGPEAWEDNVVLATYEAVSDGWDFEWTSETKSLAEELAEDQELAKARAKGKKDEEAENDVEMEGDAEAEEDAEAEDDDEIAESEDSTPSASHDVIEVDGSDDNFPSEPPEATKTDVDENIVLVRYRFRRTTPGRKTEKRIWETVALTA